MTPAIASGVVVEYRFQCFCGAPIVATAKTLTCANCGESLLIRRFKRQHWKIAPPALPHRRLLLSDLPDIGMRILLPYPWRAAFTSSGSLSGNCWKTKGSVVE
jgi:hypothetical protein